MMTQVDEKCGSDPIDTAMTGRKPETFSALFTFRLHFKNEPAISRSIPVDPVKARCCAPSTSWRLSRTVKSGLKMSGQPGPVGPQI